MLRRLVIFLTAILLWGLTALDVAAQEPSSRCDMQEIREFDFWLGEWELSWDGGRGTNTVEHILGGCVIEERFEGEGPDGKYRGRSVSTFDPERGVWLQTWVDDRGNYLDFTGRLRDDRMVLEREAVRDGQPVRQRMVWYNISDDVLDWNWEQSEDGGATWTTLWKIRYTRRE